MASYLLELYQGEIPKPFDTFPGAANYDPGKKELYWAVLTPTPPAGSPEAQFIAPVPGDATVAATTHGTETLPDAAAFALQQLAIWNPKSPPYAFKVTLPNGQPIDLTPPGAGEPDEFFAVPAALASGVGIYVIEVSLDDAASPPAPFAGRNAHLNPADLNFPSSEFYKQPLLRAIGQPSGTSGRCPVVGELEVVGGCAPGTVQFRAALTNDDGVSLEEVNWDFGDGHTLVQGPGEYTVPLSAANEYGAAGPFTATLTILRASGCQPRTLTQDVSVPTCPSTGRCPRLRRVQRVRGDRCAPGTITFRATIENPESVLLISWDFGDGTTQDGGVQVTHTFTTPGPHTVTVSILRPESCTPRMQSVSMTVPACTPQEDDNGDKYDNDDNDDNHDNDDNDNNEDGGFGFCAFLLALTIILFLAMCVAWIVTGCLGFEPISLTAAISLTVLAIASAILLIVLCATPPGGCRWLRTLLDFLNILNAIAWLLVVILGLLGMCAAIGSLIDAGILSGFITVVYIIGRAIGCLPGVGIFARRGR